MRFKSIIIILTILIGIILLGSIFNPVEAQSPTNTPRPTYTPAPTFVPTNSNVAGCPASEYMVDYSLYDYEYLSRCGQCVPGYNGINLTPVAGSPTPEITPTPAVAEYYLTDVIQIDGGNWWEGNYYPRKKLDIDCGDNDEVGIWWYLNIASQNYHTSVTGSGNRYSGGWGWVTNDTGTYNDSGAHERILPYNGGSLNPEYFTGWGAYPDLWVEFDLNGTSGLQTFGMCHGPEPEPEPPCDYAGYVDDVEQTGGVSTARDAVGEPDDNFWYEIWNPFMSGTAKFNINKKDVSRIRFLRGESTVNFYEGDMSITVYGCEGEEVSNYVSHWGDTIENIAGFLYTEKKCIDNITFDIFPNSSQTDNNWVHIDAIEVTGCDKEDTNGDCMTPWENYLEPEQTIAYIEWGDYTNFQQGECNMVFQPIVIDTTSAFYSGLIALLPPSMQASIPIIVSIPGIEICQHQIQAPSFYILGVEVPIMQYLGILVAFFVIKNLFLRL